MCPSQVPKNYRNHTTLYIDLRPYKTKTEQQQMTCHASPRKLSSIYQTSKLTKITALGKNV